MSSRLLNCGNPYVYTRSGVPYEIYKKVRVKLSAEDAHISAKETSNSVIDVGPFRTWSWR